MSTAKDQPLPSVQKHSLRVGQLFNHFFLLHDFFHRLTKSKAQNSAFFDLQLEIYNGMKAAVNTGSNAFQVIAFGSLCTYFFKGNSIKLRFLYGFLFTYWYNHIMTLGSYIGVLCRLPSVYNKTAAYYQAHPEQRNLIKQLDLLMAKQDHYQEPQLVLAEVFGADVEEKSYVANEFFAKNREKYLPKEVLEYNLHNEKRLKYMDCFLTRYVYYSFTRWCIRMRQFLSFGQEEQ